MTTPYTSISYIHTVKECIKVTSYNTLTKDTYSYSPNFYHIKHSVVTHITLDVLIEWVNDQYHKTTTCDFVINFPELLNLCCKTT